jgi:hypothetical protein
MPVGETVLPGWRIDGRHLPCPTSFLAADPALVKHVTGLDWDRFAGALAHPDAVRDPAAVSGLVAVAVSRAHPAWSARRVARYLRRLPVDALIPEH